MKAYPLRFWLINGSFLFCFLASKPTLAQIVPDATMPVNSIVTPQGNTNLIEGGTRAGGNLFHSFQEFSVPTGGEAFFNNALDVQNIFSRVTGRSISNIDGLIRANGIANLFLLNPNGIIFGPNARLNIGGSFLATTANSIKFAEGIEFSATNPQSSPLLSINVPIGLQYGKNPGEIRVQGKGQDLGLDGATESFDSSKNPLEVLPGKTLALVGGNVIVDGGILQAPGGRIELGGVAGEGTVGLNADGSLSFPEGVTGETPVPRADVSIINKAGINVLASGGGSITITARNLDISGESLLSAGIATFKGSPESVAGEVLLSVTEAMTMASSQIENIVAENAIGNSKSINITTKSLTLSNGAVLGTGTFSKGKAGSVTIVASDSVSIDGEGGILSGVTKDGEGEAGDIKITTKSLTLTNGAKLNASTLGKGKAGSVTIVADSVSLDGEGKDGFPTGVLSSVQANAQGEAGGITITTKSLTLTNGAVLATGTSGKGKAGSVTIVASDRVLIDGEGSKLASGILSGVTKDGEGDGRGINITTKSLTLTNGAQLNVGTLGKGKAGSVTIVADTVSLDGEGKDGFPTGVSSEVGVDAINGEAGGINITTKSLSVTGGAQLSANTEGKGEAGEVKIVASDRVSFDGQGKNENFSGAFSIVEENAEGEAGGVSITAKSLTVTNGAFLNAGTFGEGDAGSVTINTGALLVGDGGSVSAAVSKGGKGDPGNLNITASSLLLNNKASLTAASEKGSGGNIQLQARNIQLRRQSEISAISAPGAKEGNIDINAQTLVLLEGSQIRTDAEAPKGGSNITIAPVDSLGVAVFLSSDSVISASGNVTVEGYVEAETSDIPQVEVVDATTLVVSSCRRQRSEQSQFIVTGRGGLPPSPNEPITGEATWIDLRPIPLEESKGAGEQRSYGAGERSLVITEIVEATGWITAADGKVILTAKAPTVTPQLPWITYPNCD